MRDTRATLHAPRRRSNKPSPAELERVRHHLVDVADASNPWSAGAWCAAAAQSDWGRWPRRGKLPVVVGGTMMYAQWLVRGAPDAPKRVRHGGGLAQEFLGTARRRGQSFSSSRGPVGSVRGARAETLAVPLPPPVARAGDRVGSGGRRRKWRSAPAGPGQRPTCAARSWRHRIGPRCTTLLTKGATLCSMRPARGG